MTRPACYDREPFAPGAWMLARPAGPGTKARWRWVPAFFTDRCATWDTRPNHNETPYPLVHGWDCGGCRWLPELRA
jgi:hypothetical protein